MKVAGPPRRTAFEARADCGRAAGRSNGGTDRERRYVIGRPQRGARDRGAVWPDSSGRQGLMCTCARSLLIVWTPGLVRCRAGGSRRPRMRSRPGCVRSRAGRCMWRSKPARAGCCGAGGPAGGRVAHLAEMVETRALRERKRGAKTDRQDALWLRELLTEGRLPEAWIASEHVRVWRSRLLCARRSSTSGSSGFRGVRCALSPRRQSRAPPEISSSAGRAFSTSSNCPRTRASGSRSRW